MRAKAERRVLRLAKSKMERGEQVLHQDVALDRSGAASIHLFATATALYTVEPARERVQVTRYSVLERVVLEQRVVSMMFNTKTNERRVERTSLNMTLERAHGTPETVRFDRATSALADYVAQRAPQRELLEDAPPPYWEKQVEAAIRADAPLDTEWFDVLEDDETALVGQCPVRVLNENFRGRLALSGRRLYLLREPFEVELTAFRFDFSRLARFWMMQPASPLMGPTYRLDICAPGPISYLTLAEAHEQGQISGYTLWFHDDERSHDLIRRLADAIDRHGRFK